MEGRFDCRTESTLHPGMQDEGFSESWVYSSDRGWEPVGHDGKVLRKEPGLSDSQLRKARADSVGGICG